MLLGTAYSAQHAADHTAEDKSQLPGAITVSPTSVSDSLSGKLGGVGRRVDRQHRQWGGPRAAAGARRCCRKSAASLCSS